MFRFKKQLNTFIVYNIIFALLLSFFAFVFHSEKHIEEHKSKTKSVCLDLLSTDVQNHLHKANGGVTHEHSANCSICSLYYLDYYLCSDCKCEEISLKSSYFVDNLNSNNYIKQIFSGRFLRSPPYIFS